MPIVPLSARRLLAVTACAVTLIFSSAAVAQPLGVPSDGRSGGFRGGVVATAHPLATAVGEQILVAGGNAVDAAIAAQFALNVVEPTSSGIGGGGFMMIYRAGTPAPVIIDSREKAPAAATPDMFLGEDGSRLGSTFTNLATTGLAVGVPGTLLGLQKALDEFGSGRFSLAELIAPSIPLAEGFNINARLASLTASARTDVYAETRALFRTAQGDPLPEGFFLQQPDLAKTYRLISEQGVDVFYKGEIAAAIVAAQQRFNDDVGPAGAGRMTPEDLAAYADAGAELRQPIVGDYRGYTVYGMPPPSSGGLTVMQMLKMVERFPLGDEAQGFGFGSPQTLHVMIEAMRLAFADRAVWMGDDDPGFPPVPRAGLLADAYAVDIRGAMIDPATRMEANPAAGDPRPFDPNFGDGRALALLDPRQPEGVDTTHFSVIDADGNAVSYTSTIEGTWGSGIVVPGYGFLLNNELTDFNATPAASDEPFNPGANDVAPFKRPRSSMAPTMVFQNGRLLAGYGSPGGSSIINTVFQITLNLIDHGMSIRDAIDAPRITVSSAGGNPGRDPGFGYDAIAGIVELGHPEGAAFAIGSVQAFVVDPDAGLRYGGADARRAGAVGGTASLSVPRYDFGTGTLVVPFLQVQSEGRQLGDFGIVLQQRRPGAEEFIFDLTGAAPVD